MVCLGLEPGAAGWKLQTNPLSYGGTPFVNFHYLQMVFSENSLDMMNSANIKTVFKMAW